MLYAEKWGSRRALQAALAAATGVNLALNAVRRLREPRIHPVVVAKQELALVRGRRSEPEPATSRDAASRVDQDG